jgi:hypothetical protein
VHLTLDPDDYDEAYQLSKLEPGQSVQDVIRRALKRLLEDERGGSLQNKKT